MNLRVEEPKKRTVFIPVLLGVLLGVGISALWAAGVLWWSLKDRVVATVPASSLNDEEKAYKDRLEFFGKRADDLERLLSLLLAGSTIYALAVGYNAYQQAKDAKEKLDSLGTDASAQVGRIEDLITTTQGKIKELIDNSNKQINRMESQIAANFPLFKDIDFAIKTTTHRILNWLPTLDVVDGNFQRLSEKQKQEILFYEKALSTFEFFNTDSLRREVSGIFHVLGNFYALKFKDTEKQQGQTKQDPQLATPENPQLDEQDKERARFYLEHAISTDADNVWALNDRGYFALIFERPSKDDEARTYFAASLGSDDDQQRARYNLAWIEHKAGHYKKSIDLITAALTKGKWQTAAVPQRKADLLYNRACSLASLARTEHESQQTGLLEKALKDLEDIANAEKASWVDLHKFLEDDLKKNETGEKNGDLTLLLDKPKFSSRIEAVRKRIAEKANVVVSAN